MVNQFIDNQILHVQKTIKNLKESVLPNEEIREELLQEAQEFLSELELLKEHEE